MTAYQLDLRQWVAWLDTAHVAVFDAERAHIELYARWSESRGLAASTIGRRLSTICGFYTYCTQERLLDHNPAAHVRRPKQNYESTTLGLDRNELGAFLVQAGLGGGRDHALACLLALNGLRISEALGADIDDLDHNRGHRTLFVHRKGGKTANVPLAPRTARTLDLYIDEHCSGPIFMNHDLTRRLDRHAASRIVKRLAKAAGIDKRISPHSLRHSFITATLDAGVPLRDVQEAASHADPRTTMRYDRGRGSLDRHPTYMVATFVAGASRSDSERSEPPVSAGSRAVQFASGRRDYRARRDGDQVPGLSRSSRVTLRDELTVRLSLELGDLLAFDNQRILHGRDAFAGSTGHHFLRGCYSERDELSSRIRILERQRRLSTR